MLYFICRLLSSKWCYWPISLEKKHEILTTFLNIVRISLSSPPSHLSPFPFPSPSSFSLFLFLFLIKLFQFYFFWLTRSSSLLMFYFFLILFCTIQNFKKIFRWLFLFSFFSLLIFFKFFSSQFGIHIIQQIYRILISFCVSMFLSTYTNFYISEIKRNKYHYCYEIYIPYAETKKKSSSDI